MGAENPIPRLEACCGCIQLKCGVLTLCVLQMLASGFMIVIIGMYVIFGALYTDGDSLPMMGGAFTLFSLFIVFLLTFAELGFAFYAFLDIQRAEPTGIRYYYMFKLASLVLSLFIFFLTSYWTSPEILNLVISVSISLYCIWCIWSLHESLMLGGEAAFKAGFTLEEASENSPLLRDESARTKEEKIAWKEGVREYV